MRHVTRMNESRRMHEWVMSNIGMSSVTRVSHTISHVTHNKSCHTCEWVRSHTMSHVTHANKSCLTNVTNESVISTSLVTHMSHVNESSHRYEWVMSPTVSWCSTRVYQCIHESCHTHPLILSRAWMSHGALMNESGHPEFLGTLPELLVSQYIFEACQEYWYPNIYLRHVARMCESCHMYEWVISYVWMRHVTCMNKSCHMHEYVMSHAWISHVTCMKQSCHMYEWVMSYACLSHVTCMLESCHMHEWVMSHVWMSHVTCMNGSCPMHAWL